MTSTIATPSEIARRAVTALASITCAVALSSSAGCFLFEGVPHSQRDESIMPPQLEGSEIVPKLGNPVPMNTQLLDEDGKLVALSSVLATDKPTLLILGYWECPTLCSFVLNATTEALGGVEGLVAGTDYNVVAVGIDPSETPGLAKKKQANYLAALAKAQGKPSIPTSSWRFLTAPQDEGFLKDKRESKAVRTLAEAVGFGYRYDLQTETYAHGAGIFFIGPDGTLSRTLWGIQFRSKDVRLAVVEAGQGLVGTVIDRVVLSCFQFGPEGQYSMYVWGVMRLGGIAMVIGMAIFLITLFRREKRQEQQLERDTVGMQ